LHIGLAAIRNYFALERQSFRDCFEGADVDGKEPPLEECQKLFAHCPPILKPTFECEDIWRRWRRNLVDDSIDVRCSDDPGSYLCGFVYYLSMSWFWNMKDEEERPVMFLHVPDLPTEQEIESGRQATIGLIRALAESREKVGSHDPLKTMVQPTPEEALKQSKWSGYD